MKLPKKLADAWMEHVNARKHNMSPSLKEFEARIEQLIFGVAVSVAKDGARGDLLSANHEDAIHIMKQRYAGLFAQSGYVQTVEHFYKLTHENEAYLCDSRKQEDWATSWDHAKTFIFRMITTLMIAGVILLTGYLAQHWGIPLPMLRALG